MAEKEYIEREAAIEEINKSLKGVFVLPVGKSIMDRVPAADVRPVVRGKWIKHHWTEHLDGFECSNCHTTWDTVTTYCPFCGAKMEES